MGSEISTHVQWRDVKKIFYKRTHFYLKEGNKLHIASFDCRLSKMKANVVIENFDHEFKTSYFEEICSSKLFSFKNVYYVDAKNIVRKANMYHSEVVGYIYVERLDR